MQTPSVRSILLLRKKKTTAVTKENITTKSSSPDPYDGLLGDVVELLAEARQTSARAVNSLMTATYWEIGRRIVEFEQEGKERAEYGTDLLKQLGKDLTAKLGRGFGWRNLYSMRGFFLTYPAILQTTSSKSGPNPKLQTASAKLQPTESKRVTADSSSLTNLAAAFPLPWSHYVRLLKVDNAEARNFYETEALRGGWSVRQLDRQVSSLFYERTALSTNKAKMLTEGTAAKPGEVTTSEQQIKDPFVLEFLDLKDEYSELDLEAAIIHKLEEFLLELGSQYAFVGRQKRLRIGDQWFRIDLLFFHRGLKCLVVIDLKIGKFSHADAGQMHMYLNYAKEHWVLPGENPPVGLILCAEKDDSVAHYALDGLPNQVMAGEYRLALPDEATLVEQVKQAQQIVENRKPNT